MRYSSVNQIAKGLFMLENTQGLFNPQGDEYMTNREDEEIFFAEEIEVSQCEKSWKILIVDDDVEVHEVTKLALSEFTFEGKSLTFISAYCGREAKHLIQSHPDTAIVFLDVVMETENAGLQVIKYIREELGNSLVRIILRTGQPGQAPEDVVAVNYGIDDYKTKTELTSQKLFITVVTALRAFSTLMQMLEMSRTLELELVQSKQVKVRGCEQGHEQREKLQLELSDQAGASYTMSEIARIARMLLRIADEHSAKLGISQNKLAVLIYLSTEPERRASPSSLAKHCGVSRAAMTGLLDGLEQNGYVERDDHPSDRRALMVKLTQKGQHFLDWIAPRDRYHSELMSLDEVERQKLIELVMKVIELSDETVTEMTN